ncbi:MAG: hypothetical protein IJ757_00120 [Clostridiales bacterium]|nr:hypothetical protein [Clostridiales bacterium]
MDYAEGLFLGRYWSDTDFENRRHVELFLLYGILTAIFLILFYWTGSPLMGVGRFGTFSIVIMSIMFFLNPVLCFRYYIMPLWGKICVLTVKVYKAYLIMSLTVSLILPRLTVQSNGLRDFLIDYLNSTLERYTDRFASGGGSFSTVMGVLTGGIHVVLVFVLGLAALIVVPGLFVLIFKAVQYVYDFIIDRLILRRFFRYRR